MERNNGVFKSVVERLQKGDEKSSPEKIIERALQLKNIIKASKILNAFQLARGYAPSIFGFPRTIIPQDLVDAHMDRESLRAAEIIMNAKTAETNNNSLPTTGRKELIYHKSSKQN